ncbi:MAG: YicC family protein [Candidatus Solibacter usitatus]|nr:YicC family protein [Candidatus Solibacter usitatus]
MAETRSMTGFARLRKLTPLGEMTVTMKGVNHRSLDVHLYLPADLDACENAIRNAVKKRVSRGHITLRLHWARIGTAKPLEVNAPLLESWLAAFRKAREAHGLSCEPDLNTAFRIPGILNEGDSEPDDTLEATVVALVDEATVAYNETRAKEGVALHRVIQEANERIGGHAKEMAALRENAMPALQQRLKEKLDALLAGVGLEPQRLAQEAAILADKSDITEEIQRLSIHSKEVKALLDKGGEVGKKLDFLMQEMGRETNTVLSKTNGAGEIGMRLTELGIEVKAEVERIREQSLNIE